QLRTDRAGIGERQTNLKAEPGRRVVERKNLQCIVFFGDDNARQVLARQDLAREVLLCRTFFTRTGTDFARKGSSRRGVVPRELTFDTVDGQAWQPQAEDTPSVFRRGTHHISIP